MAIKLLVVFDVLALAQGLAKKVGDLPSLLAHGFGAV